MFNSKLFLWAHARGRRLPEVWVRHVVAKAKSNSVNYRTLHRDMSQDELRKWVSPRSVLNRKSKKELGQW